MSAGVRWHEVTDAEELQRKACRRILDTAARAIQTRGHFLIVLAGGNTPRQVYRMLRAATTDWSLWRIYFGDERCLAADNPDRNSRMATDTWLDHVSVPQVHVHPIPAELGAAAATLAYTDTLRSISEFDLVLLGLGGDGHTASLFPHHDWGIAPDAPDVLAVFDSPKPPPQRVSLSAARLSRAHEVLFLVAGESKRDAVTRWRAGEALPASAIQPAAGADVLVESALLAPALLRQHN